MHSVHPPDIRWSDRQPIDTSLYNFDAEELAFLKRATGIEDEAELKEHICAVQAAAVAVFPYHCIRNFAFTKYRGCLGPSILNCPQLAKDMPKAILLDIGCCFGNDVRKAILMGGLRTT